MEATRLSATRFGRPMLRDRSGHEGGGQLLIARRERDFTRGLLSEMGHDNNYLVFQPSRMFMRVLGDGVLRLNDALSAFRSQAADHVLFLAGDDLQAHYAELDARIEDVRDRVVALTEYCNRGFDGQFREVLESVEASAAPAAEEAPEGEAQAVRPADASQAAGVIGARPGDTQDVFEALRQRNVEQGILTDVGRQEGYVAFQPCPFYGRFVSEIAYTLNDALRRMEGRTSYYVAGGNGEVVRPYYLTLKNGLAALHADLDGIIAFCGRKVA